MKTINILAVNDPAVNAYIDETKGFLREIESNLSIDINFEIFPFETYYDQLMEAFENHTYDLVMVAGHLWLPAFVQKGYLAPIKKDMAVEIDEDILPSIAKEMSYEDEHYLMPSFCDGHLLTYRKSILGKELPSKISISQMVEEVEKLPEQDTRTSVVLKSHPSELFLDVLPYLRSEGCEPFSKEGQPQVNNEKCKKGIKKYMSMVSYGPKDINTYDNDRVREAIQKKETVFAVTWGGQMGAVIDDQCLEKDDIGYAALDESWNVTWSFGINKNSKNQELGVEVMKYLVKAKIDQEVGKISGNPTRYSNFEKDKTNYPWYPLAKEMIEGAEPLPSFPLLADFIGMTTEALNDIIHNGKQIDETLEEVEMKMMQIYNQNQ